MPLLPLECPVYAIDYRWMKYEINPDKCIQCCQCVEVCNISAIGTGEPETIIPRKLVKREANVIIIGAG